MANSFGSHVSVEGKEVLEEAFRIVKEVTDDMADAKVDSTLVAGMAQVLATLIAMRR